ncbi:Sec-independent protein translocase protein TatB [Oceanicoccus sp. KOV_DT_Chl]|uniref:Sec-independent protein translocase protein TatB n=1 Tax=Oceanicoccus sp. KOV_DT_Chl TaxID=1904639 RepID=UPI000C7B6B8C|nr:Sec-independent protein translocase protein TatB [Oceanicoccus sp. KOV_DT_Chl]
MFDIGFQELLLIGVIALVIMGPERLPGAVRSASMWIARLRRSFQQIKNDIEREIGADDIKQQLHNESIMQSLEQTKSNILDTANSLKPDMDKLQYDISDIVKSETAATDTESAAEEERKNTQHNPTKTL